MMYLIKILTVGALSGLFCALFLWALSPVREKAEHKADQQAAVCRQIECPEGLTPFLGYFKPQGTLCLCAREMP